ncbi:putative dNA integration/recombination/inversion protein (plasmid) [Bacillus pseudomycoides]|nr:putative dNA integration/recombination/inversion protein [Bacillus pseudomycoides]
MILFVTDISTFKRFIEETYLTWKNREISGVIFMNRLGLKKNTFYKVMKEYENQLNISGDNKAFDINKISDNVSEFNMLIP